MRKTNAKNTKKTTLRTKRSGNTRKGNNRALFHTSSPNRPIGHIVPMSMRTTLRFSTGLTLSGTSNPMYRVFRANSCFDPDYTGVGSQPTGFDELSAFYSYYRVHSIRATAIGRSTNSTSTLPLMQAWIPQSTTTVDSNYVEILGNPHVVHAEMPSADAGFTNPLTFRLDIRNFFGVTPAVYSSDDYSALTSANPLKPMYLVFYAQDFVSSGSTLGAQVLFTLDFDVEFYERVPLVRS